MSNNDNPLDLARLALSSRLTERFQSAQNKARHISQQVFKPSNIDKPTPCHPESPELSDFAHDKACLKSWPNKQTQWWYFTGHLQSICGEEFGFQCVFFERHAHHDFVGPIPTRLIKAEYFVAHFAISHISSKSVSDSFQFHQRGGVAQPHVGFCSEDSFDISVDHWRAHQNPDASLFVETRQQNEALSLHFTPTKPLARHGDRGFMKKGPILEDGSFYCSYTHLQTNGYIEFKGKRFQVSGASWMDHEKMSCNDQVFHRGWDWYSLQFEDDSELMLYRLKQNSTQYLVESSGSYFAPDRQQTTLLHDDIEYRHLENWKSPKSGAIYPLVQQISIPKIGLEFILRPKLNNQEMDTCKTSFCTYWEGAVSAQAIKDNRSLMGQGYMELVGYDPRPRATFFKLLTLPTLTVSSR